MKETKQIQVWRPDMEPTSIDLRQQHLDGLDEDELLIEIGALGFWQRVDRAQFGLLSELLLLGTLPNLALAFIGTGLMWCVAHVWNYTLKPIALTVDRIGAIVFRAVPTWYLPMLAWPKVFDKTTEWPKTER